MASHKWAVFFQFFLLLLTAAAGQESGGVCRTAEDRDGKCIDVRSCPAILSLLQDTPNVRDNPSVLEEVRQAYCGIFDGVEHVCCELPITRPGEEEFSERVQAGRSILLNTSCGINDADRVANGVNAVLSEFPWMALLQYRTELGTSFDCGGSLITAQYVLTAAHCILVRQKKLIAVRLGEHDLSSTVDCNSRGRKCAPPVQDIAIEEAIYHKDYNRTNIHNDIGLLRLAKKATIHSSVRPICLPVTPFARANQFSALLIAGWGRMETGRSATVLQRALVRPITNEACQETFKILKLLKSQMCAGGENEVDSCKGDSGGPAFYSSRYLRGARFVQYGIISAGVLKCGSTFPGIYVRVLSYLDWIAGHIEA